MNNKEETIQITISKEVYDKLLNNRSYSKAIKYALISDKTVQITISKEAYENLNSLISMFKASGTNYNELLSHDKAIKYILTHKAGSWTG